MPATGNGAAGEIIPLAHLGGFLTGPGEALDADGAPVPAADALREAGVTPYTFGPKEGVAFLQGVPVATARAVLLAADARLLAAQALTVAAAEVAAGAARRATPTTPRWPAATTELGAVLGRAARARRRRAGPPDAPGAGVVPGGRPGAWRTCCASSGTSTQPWAGR